MRELIRALGRERVAALFFTDPAMRPRPMDLDPEEN